MKSNRHLIAILSLAALGACSTTMTAPSQQFLTGYHDLSPYKTAGASGRRAVVAVDPARVNIEDVAWLAAPSVELTAAERGELLSLLGDELRANIRALPAAPNGRPALLRAAITRVETVSPALNTVSTLLLIAPWDRGGAALEIEAVDAETGEQLAAFRLGYFAPMSDLRARFSKLAAAEIAIKKSAKDFSALLQPVNDPLVGAR